MKLLSIKANGFKSFADKIEINVGDGITGIVGPNGSGKSNVVDAVRWVLGETSLKEIRGGDQQSDVIFNGSKTRGKASRAWVSLTFENSDHYLACDFDTVEIKREVFSNGDSEYYINNSKVRKKDITDLFLDTGTSANSFSIISQGKISEILKGRPLDRRTIIEEAAGVLKYKKRKEDTLKKIKDTNTNLEKVSLVIDELNISLEPLKEESIIAKKYLDTKEELESIEVGLLANDINKINNEEMDSQEKLKKLNDELLTLDSKSNIDSSKLESLKLKNIEYDNKINCLSEEVIKLSSEISSLETKKQVISERQKYEVEDQKLENNILILKDNIINIKKDIELKKDLIKNISESVIKEKDLYDKLNQEYQNDNFRKNTLISELTRKNKELIVINSKKDNLNEMLENDSKTPYQVKNVLNNPRLKGIHNVLSKIIDVDYKYTTSIETALGANINVVVVDNEECAKEAINYLNDSDLGRVTFFPINIIKSRYINEEDIKICKSISGFIDVASNLIKYNPIYKNIIENQLGNTLIVKNMDSMNELGRKLNYKYRIITLNGEVLYAGGSITGGKNKKTVGNLNIKYELHNLSKESEILEGEIKLLETHINEVDNDLTILDNKVFTEKNKYMELNNDLANKTKDLNDLNDKLSSYESELSGTNNLLNKNTKSELDEVLENLLNKTTLKDKKTIELSNLKSNKNDIQNEINELEIINKSKISDYNKKMNEIRELEVLISKNDVKLDALLNRLSDEYSITFEKALNDYPLEMDSELARGKVNSLKRIIRDLGEVNTGSIKEYERVSERYEFLSSQKKDLEGAINDLLLIINDLDTTMIQKFKSTFDAVNNEFKEVFKKLFKGGEASLALTDPDDLLNTGVEIIATPPGKSLKSINAMSGGEMTLTAISLLFSILNIKTVPFCILDEVEAALDEANVDIFGKYINEASIKHQFIVITHKKRTMEYVNNLYGITMQESGVSKLVSVKLDEIK